MCHPSKGAKAVNHLATLLVGSCQIASALEPRTTTQPTAPRTDVIYAVHVIAYAVHVIARDMQCQSTRNPIGTYAGRSGR